MKNKIKIGKGGPKYGKIGEKKKKMQHSYHGESTRQV